MIGDEAGTAVQQDGWYRACHDVFVGCSIKHSLLHGANAGRPMRPLLHDGATFDALDRGMNQS